MSKKYLVYAILSALALIGAGTVSAHGWLGGFNEANPEEVAQRQEAMFQNKAELLGISLDEMKNYWAEGKSLKEIAEAEGITQEDLQEQMKQARQEQIQNRLQILVDNNVISREQADQRLQFMEGQMSNNRTDKGFGRGFGKCSDQ